MFPFSCLPPYSFRWIASKRRPLAGIYSASARDAEGTHSNKQKININIFRGEKYLEIYAIMIGLARVDLMLSNLRRSCDGGANARLDSWSIQMDSIKFSSRY
jgi:hypothetical protein